MSEELILGDTGGGWCWLWLFISSHRSGDGSVDCCRWLAAGGDGGGLGLLLDGGGGLGLLLDGGMFQAALWKAAICNPVSIRGGQHIPHLGPCFCLHLKHAVHLLGIQVHRGLGECGQLCRQKFHTNAVANFEPDLGDEIAWFLDETESIAASFVQHV
ncbi:MAG: hypothetical protein GY820_12490 [Gammaproteobacteria bacterium]|nr:hypothetical protein [Gammaproteobacteria bacterium]